MYKPFCLMGKARWFAMASCIIGFHAAAIERAEAVPVHFGSNSYELIFVSNPYVGSNNYWSTAQANAAASSFMGVNGHLATITSQAENDFLFGLISGLATPPTGFAGAWIGGKDPEGWLVGPEAGQSFAYTNWGGSEPNNSGYAYMSIGTTTAVGQWLDDSIVSAGDCQGCPHSLNDPVIGYFVEYEGTGAVPLPTAPPLFASGLGAMGLLGWRRKRKKAAATAAA